MEKRESESSVGSNSSKRRGGRYWRNFSVNVFKNKKKKSEADRGDIKKGETVYTNYFKSRGTQIFIDDTDESPEV